MPSPAVTRPLRRWKALPQIERETILSPTAVARQVIEEASLWLGVTLHRRYAAGLAFRAHRCYAHSPSFREKVRRPGDRGRDTLYIFMRHWLAARLDKERPDLLARLPRSYATGEPLPARPTVARAPAPQPAAAADGWLSPDARLLITI